MYSLCLHMVVVESSVHKHPMFLGYPVMISLLGHTTCSLAAMKSISFYWRHFLGFVNFDVYYSNAREDGHIIVVMSAVSEITQWHLLDYRTKWLKITLQTLKF